LICGKDRKLLNVSTGGGKRSTKSCVVDFIIVLLGEFALLVAAAHADFINIKPLKVLIELHACRLERQRKLTGYYLSYQSDANLR
jgi:hypothetical protein